MGAIHLVQRAHALIPTYCYVHMYARCFNVPCFTYMLCMHTGAHKHTHTHTHTHTQDPSNVKSSPSSDKFPPVFMEVNRLCTDDIGNMGAGKARAAMDMSTGPPNISASPENKNGSSIEGFLPIKPEPDSGETTPTCLKPSPLSSNAGCAMISKAPPTSLPFPLPLSTTSSRNSRPYGTPDAKRKRLLPSPMRGHSFSSTEEADDDDLKLRAEDCIDGVISTPPIKPLEEGDDPPITPSPTSMATNVRCPSNPPTNTSTGSVSNTPSTPTLASSQEKFSRKNSTNVAEDLNEFYRIMNQVAEKERLSSATTASSSSNHIDMYKSTSASPPSRLGAQSSSVLPSPPPYHTTPPRHSQAISRPPTASYYGPRHISLSVSRASPAASTSSASSSPGGVHLFNPALLPASSLGLQQTQLHPQQLQQPHCAPQPTLAQVGANLQFASASPLLQQQQQLQLQAKQHQLQMLTKMHHPQTQQQMHMLRLSQPNSSTAQLQTPVPLSVPITSQTYSFAHNNHGPRIYTTVSSLPPPPTPHPHTPTTPLEHFCTYPSTQQRACVSPTHPHTQQYPRQITSFSGYPYTTQNAVQMHTPLTNNPHLQLLQSSSSSASSTWGYSMQPLGMSADSYKDALLSQPCSYLDSQQLQRNQKPIQTVASLGSFPLQKVSLPASAVPQTHHSLPPSYLPSYGTSSPLGSSFPCLTYPPNM